MTATSRSNGVPWMYDDHTKKWSRIPRKIESFGQAMHELRKAHKGLRRQARKIKALEAELRKTQYFEYQYYMAMQYMGGFAKVEPYEGWHPEAQYWIDQFKKQYE